MSASTLTIPNQGGKNFLRMKSEYGIYEAWEVGQLVARMPSTTGDLVTGLLPSRSVNLMVGESGIGKSALAYQLGLAVATGAPFLGMPAGMPSRQGKVLLVDYENSLADAHWMMEQQRKHLSIESVPHTFQLWPMILNPLQSKVEEVISAFAPDLVIIDSLRSFSPAMESDNATAAQQIRRLRVTAAESGTCFLLIHHLRKNRAGAEREQDRVMDWLLRTAGARALVNQTDVRLGIAPHRHADTLELRGHFRAHGEIGPFLLRRKYTEDRQPLGYERLLLDPQSLNNVEHEAAFARLPETFTPKDARSACGMSKETTRVFIHKLIDLGLVQKDGYGVYRRMYTATPVSA